MAERVVRCVQLGQADGPGQMTDEDELTGVAVSAQCWIAAGHSQEKRRCRFEGCEGWRGCIEARAAACQLGGFVAIGGEAVVADTFKEIGRAHV